MEPVFQAIIIVVIAAAAAATVYKTVPGMSLLLSMAAALLALFLCIGLLEPLAAFFATRSRSAACPASTPARCSSA